MRADQLTTIDVGKKIRWADRHGKHSIVAEHIYVERGDRRTVVLLRPAGGNLDTTITLDGHRLVKVSKP